MSKSSFLKDLSLIKQLFRFGVVGVGAAAMHFSVVVFIVQMNAMTPLYANVIGFLFGFQVSYWGHRLWTFQQNDISHRIAVPKLLVVQMISFFANETLFYLLLSFKLSYPIALLLVLMILPIFTYTSSRLWVFRKS